MKNPVDTYFTSDWHIGHKNILDLCDRPFRNLNHMHEALIKNYNACVREQDTCYFLGDMGMGKSPAIEKAIPRLNGTKILILGNHDSSKGIMQRLGFDVVMYGAVLWIAGHQVTLTHCPLREVVRENIEGMRGAEEGEPWHGESRHKEKYSINSWDQFHLHGHVHSPNKGKSEKICGKQYDIGVDANNYRPVLSSVIESWIAKYKSWETP